MIVVNAELEQWTGSPVIRKLDGRYRRISASEYKDAAAGLSPRQGVFYRNLIRIAEALGSNLIPVDFELNTGEQLYLDRGCVKIAELAGFLGPLSDDPSGVVSKLVPRQHLWPRFEVVI